MPEVASCPSCSHPQSAEVSIHQHWKESRCPSCQRTLIATTFEPVMKLNNPGRSSLGVDEILTAMCFNCPTQAATTACDGCGCYLCQNCVIEWFGEKICLSCLHKRREINKAKAYHPRAIIWDNLALLMIGLPLVFVPFYGWCLAVPLSPIVIFLLISKSKASRGIVPRGPFRYWLTMCLAVMMILSAVGAIVAIRSAITSQKARVKKVYAPEPDLTKDNINPDEAVMPEMPEPDNFDPSDTPEQ